MPSQNRVTPTSEITAMPAHGTLMGNRGCLHVGQEIVRSYNGKLWIICELAFQDRRVPQWAPGRYTPLFFHDEAVALAAGHRPCGECRHTAYMAFKRAWQTAFGASPSADDMNQWLHVDRLDGKRQRTHQAAWTSLPDGSFVSWEGQPALVLDGSLLPWRDGRYEDPIERPATGQTTVLTPRCTVDVLRAGYQPRIAA